MVEGLDKIATIGYLYTMELQNRHLIAPFSETEWRKIKAYVALNGFSIAQWVREIALRELNQPPHKEED